MGPTWGIFFFFITGTLTLLLNDSSAADGDQAGVWGGGLRCLHRHDIFLLSGLRHHTVTVLHCITP